MIAPTVTSLTIVGAGETKTKIAARADAVRSPAEGLPRRERHDQGPDTDRRQGAVVGNGGKGGNGGAGGDGANGGAILNAGSLTLIDSAVTNSRAGDGGGGGFGAGSVRPAVPEAPVAPGVPAARIYNTGDLTLQGATVAGNSAGAGGAGGTGGNATTDRRESAAPAARAAKEAASQMSVARLRWSTARSMATTPATVGMAETAVPGRPAETGVSEGRRLAAEAGIVSTGGTLSITNSTFASNSAGDGGVGGNGGGRSGGSAGAGGNGGAGGNWRRRSRCSASAAPPCRA